MQQMNELHQINLKTELEQLKSQVNPHFLFNTLNTIGGLGLGNIKRRLQLLYPGNHALEIKENPHTYIVNLTFPL